MRPRYVAALACAAAAFAPIALSSQDPAARLLSGTQLAAALSGVVWEVVGRPAGQIVVDNGPEYFCADQSWKLYAHRNTVHGRYVVSGDRFCIETINGLGSCRQLRALGNGQFTAWIIDHDSAELIGTVKLTRKDELNCH